MTADSWHRLIVGPSIDVFRVMENGQEVAKYVSGSSFTAFQVAQRLGIDTLGIFTVGDDARGDWIVSQLTTSNAIFLKCQSVTNVAESTSGGVLTGSFRGDIADRGAVVAEVVRIGRRNNGAFRLATGVHPSRAWFAEALLNGKGTPGRYVPTGKRAMILGKKLFGDERLFHVADNADMFFMNEEELKAFFYGILDEKTAHIDRVRLAHRFLGKNKPLIVTRGKDGATLALGDEIVNLPAIEVGGDTFPVGAGDTFAATVVGVLILHGVQSFYDLKMPEIVGAIRSGMKAASIKVQGKNGPLDLPSDFKEKVL